MSLQLSITFDDFECKRDAQQTECWLASSLVGSPLGPFAVELTAAPDDDLIRTANETIELLVRERQTILNHVYGLYQLAADDKRWMKDHGVPRDLDKDQIADYVSKRFISVRRDHLGEAKGSISMRVKWDDEHRVLFGIRNGRVVRESP